MASVIFPADCAGVWSRQAADQHPKVLFRTPGGSKGTLAVEPSGRTSLAGHAPFRNPSKASFRPISVLRPKPGFPCALSGHIELTDNRAPLTASAVRQACSEELARCVFRRCCGHRSHPDQVELPCSLSGCYTWRRRSFLPFRHTEAAPVWRVVQAKNAGVIHRGADRWWTSPVCLWTESFSAAGRGNRRYRSRCPSRLSRNYLSLCAKSRNRRAFSLMKPSASFWS